MGSRTKTKIRYFLTTSQNRKKNLKHKDYPITNSRNSILKDDFQNNKLRKTIENEIFINIFFKWMMRFPFKKF